MSITKNIEAKIRIEARKQRLTIYELCANISMTEAGFYKMISAGSIKVKTLESIANTLNVPIASFFADIEVSAEVPVKPEPAKPEPVISKPVLKVYSTEAWHLSKQIKLLERTIEDKNQIIKLLSKRSNVTDS
jgi:transcriptional regulator with XRE-family HTH domain